MVSGPLLLTDYATILPPIAPVCSIDFLYYALDMSSIHNRWLELGAPSDLAEYERGICKVFVEVRNSTCYINFNDCLKVWYPNNSMQDWKHAPYLYSEDYL